MGERFTDIGIRPESRGGRPREAIARSEIGSKKLSLEVEILRVKTGAFRLLWEKRARGALFSLRENFPFIFEVPAAKKQKNLDTHWEVELSGSVHGRNSIFHFRETLFLLYENS